MLSRTTVCLPCSVDLQFKENGWIALCKQKSGRTCMLLLSCSFWSLWLVIVDMTANKRNILKSMRILNKALKITHLSYIWAIWRGLLVFLLNYFRACDKTKIPLPNGQLQSIIHVWLPMNCICPVYWLPERLLFLVKNALLFDVLPHIV